MAEEASAADQAAAAFLIKKTTPKKRAAKKAPAKKTAAKKTAAKKTTAAAPARPDVAPATTDSVGGKGAGQSDLQRAVKRLQAPRKSGTVRTPLGDAPVIPVALMSLGAYLCWFAIHYWASDTKWPTDPLKALLTGKPLPTPDRSAANAAIASIAAAGVAAGAVAAQAQATGAAEGAAGAAAAAGGATAIGTRIASDAKGYVGTGYDWGGNADAVGNWDCSSFVSYVLGHDLGLGLPGGGKWGQPGFPPNAHGPTTLSYMLYGTAVAQSQVQAGDLIVSSEHMGIILNSSQYVSARTPALGVGIDNWPAGFPSGPPVYRRVA